jgi:glutamate N-acetyltransferase / amino-acid N-acetyltransferase
MSVTAAKGFRAAGVAAGMKDAGRDVALIVNDGPAKAAAAVFTRNRVKAAPVLWSQQVVRDGRLDAVVVNSGGANACTGAEGFGDTHATAEHVAATLGVSAADVAVCSTGLIGVRLRLGPLLGGVDKAAARLSAAGGDDAAVAILTTDTVPKQAVAVGGTTSPSDWQPNDDRPIPVSSTAVQTTAGEVGDYTIGGMAKGAGMLAPALATMLVVLTTDADVSAADLDRALRSATRRTFDRLDSDGCLSTNDTVLLLASGASGARPPYDEFARVVEQVCADLAAQLLSDAEGASKTIAIEVSRAATEADAVTVGRAIARNNLVKCAIHGEDPNWGRILAAIGTTDAAFEPERLAVAVNGVWVCRDGGIGEPRELVDMSPPHVTITVDLAAGNATATVHTTDLTAAYVHENSAYSS